MSYQTGHTLLQAPEGAGKRVELVGQLHSLIKTHPVFDEPENVWGRVFEHPAFHHSV